MYHIGDKIFYPMHGAGIVVGIEEKKILGETHKYYILQMPVRNMKAMLPVDNAQSIGIREIISENAANNTIAFFHQYIGETSNDNWNKRYRDNVEKIKSSSLLDVAAVTKALLLQERKKSLSNAERKMLSNAKHILISELVLAKKSTYAEIESLLAL